MSLNLKFNLEMLVWFLASSQFLLLPQLPLKMRGIEKTQDAKLFLALDSTNTSTSIIKQNYLLISSQSINSEHRLSLSIYSIISSPSRIQLYWEK